MFTLKGFVKKTLMDAIGHQPDFWVEANALGWYEKGVLGEDDLAEIEAMIEARNMPEESKIEPETNESEVVEEDIPDEEEGAENGIEAEQD